MGFVQSQKEKEKRQSRGKKQFSKVKSFLKHLYCRAETSSYTLTSMLKGDSAYFPLNQRQMTIPTGAFPGAGGRAAVELLLHASQALLLQPRSRERGWCGGGRRWGPGQAEG